MKILIVEDTDAQRDWAEKTIIGHEIYYARSKEEVEWELNYDLVLSDLEIPKETNDEPKAATGMRLFKEFMDALMKGTIKGLAMVSNLEHHAMDDESYEWEIRENLNIIKSLAGLYKYGSPDPFHMKKRDRGVKNLAVLVDSIHIYWFPGYYDKKTGEVFCPNDDQRANRIPSLLERVRSGEVIPLKPWKEVVEFFQKEIEGGD